MLLGESQGLMAISAENHTVRFYGCSDKCRIKFTFVHVTHEKLQMYAWFLIKNMNKS